MVWRCRIFGPCISLISCRIRAMFFTSCPSMGPKYRIFIPSKIFCCWAARDFRLFPNLIKAFRRSSLSNPILNNRRDVLKRSWLYRFEVVRLNRYCFMPPTLRSMAMSLSLSMISRLFAVDEALFNPSKASPPLMDPSPITATTWRSFSPFLSAATAIPNAAEMELEA